MLNIERSENLTFGKVKSRFAGKTLIIFVIVSSCVSYSQTEYEAEPGTKGNQINLTVLNNSEINAQDINVSLLKKSSFINFVSETKNVESIAPGKEELITFTFDIKRNIPVNTKDTIEFIITDNNSIYITKQFMFNYTPPKDYKLEQNFPNPFNPATTIQYQLPADSKVTLKVYDILGSEVVTLINDVQEAGYKEVLFNANNLSSGIYIYRLSAGKYVSTKKMLMVK